MGLPAYFSGCAASEEVDREVAAGAASRVSMEAWNCVSCVISMAICCCYYEAALFIDHGVLWLV